MTWILLYHNLPIYNNILVVMVYFNPLIVALIHPPERHASIATICFGGMAFLQMILLVFQNSFVKDLPMAYLIWVTNRCAYKTVQLCMHFDQNLLTNSSRRNSSVVYLFRMKLARTRCACEREREKNLLFNKVGSRYRPSYSSMQLAV